MMLVYFIKFCRAKKEAMRRVLKPQKFTMSIAGTTAFLLGVFLTVPIVITTLAVLNLDDSLTRIMPQSQLAQATTVARKISLAFIEPKFLAANSFSFSESLALAPYFVHSSSICPNITTDPLSPLFLNRLIFSTTLSGQNFQVALYGPPASPEGNGTIELCCWLPSKVYVNALQWSRCANQTNLPGHLLSLNSSAWTAAFQPKLIALRSPPLFVQLFPFLTSLRGTLPTLGFSNLQNRSSSPSLIGLLVWSSVASAPWYANPDLWSNVLSPVNVVGDKPETVVTSEETLLLADETLSPVTCVSGLSRQILLSTSVICQTLQSFAASHKEQILADFSRGLQSSSSGEGNRTDKIIMEPSSGEEWFFQQKFSDQSMTVVPLPVSHLESPPPYHNSTGRPRWFLIRGIPTASYSAALLQARGKIIVTSFGISICTVIFLIISMRAVRRPLLELRYSIRCLVELNLDRIKMMDISNIVEIANIQQSVSYLAIRLYHYMRFLPDRLVLQHAAAEGASKQRSGGNDEAENSSTQAPTHTLRVRVVYESRHHSRNTLRERRNLDSKIANFEFAYRITDKLLSALLRACRENLGERPGEVFLLFVKTNDGGKRQLMTDEDVLFAIEYFCTKTTRPILELVVRKGSLKSVMPLVIAFGTIASIVSKFSLSSTRLSSDDSRIRFLGLLLLVSVFIQLTQNTLISLYLIRRFVVLDPEFAAWKAVSTPELTMGVLFGAINISNFELIGCHVRLHHGFRLNAPINETMLKKLRTYSIFGFVVGDVVPFALILIEALLKNDYQDPVVLATILSSLLSVGSILVRHGVIRFVLSAPSRESLRKSELNSEEANAKNLLLSRKFVTLLQIGISEEIGLVNWVHPELLEQVCEQLYAVSLETCKRFGGMLLCAKGLSLQFVFNAQINLPHHCKAALECFHAMQDEIELNVLHPFFSSQRFRDFLVDKKLSPASALRFHNMHRVIGVILSGHSLIGFVGTLTSQTLQQLGLFAHLADGLYNLNEMYSTTLLLNDVAVREPGMEDVLIRQIDKIQVDPGLYYSDAGTGESGGVGGNKFNESDELTIGVYEAVFSDFGSLLEWEQKRDELLKLVELRNAQGRQAYVMSSKFFAIDEDDMTDRHELSREALKLHQARVGGLGSASTMVSLIKEFDRAFASLNSTGNPDLLRSYLRNLHGQRLHDQTGARVFFWAQFMGATNESKALRFPRILSVLGISRHPCEGAKLCGTLRPVYSTDAAVEVIQNLQSSKAKRDKLLRPPRSERRAKQAATIGDDVVSDVPVLEQVIGSRRFTVQFSEPRSL